MPQFGSSNKKVSGVFFSQRTPSLEHPEQSAEELFEIVLREKVSKEIIDGLTEKLGREPSPEDINTVLERLMQAMQASGMVEETLAAYFKALTENECKKTDPPAV